jgi:hypothetical protein
MPRGFADPAGLLPAVFGLSGAWKSPRSDRHSRASEGPAVRYETTNQGEPRPALCPTGEPVPLCRPQRGPAPSVTGRRRPNPRGARVAPLRAPQGRRRHAKGPRASPLGPLDAVGLPRIRELPLSRLLSLVRASHVPPTTRGLRGTNRSAFVPTPPPAYPIYLRSGRPSERSLLHPLRSAPWMPVPLIGWTPSVRCRV